MPARKGLRGEAQNLREEFERPERGLGSEARRRSETKTGNTGASSTGSVQKGGRRGRRQKHLEKPRGFLNDRGDIGNHREGGRGGL